MSDSNEARLLELEERIRQRIETYADNNAYQLNPDTSIVDTVVRGLVKRQLKFGKPYCPCRVLTGDPEKDEKSVCPCEYHKVEIEQDGICHCRLLTRPDYKPS